MSKRGKFIVIEGSDGSGKGTIMAHLMKAFAHEHVVFTREPGGTPLGEEIRTILMRDAMCTKAELLLFEAARAEHVEKIIEPALARGIHVISDRFDASTEAYQVRGRWDGKHEDFFRSVNADVVGTTKPDLYIFCDLPPDVSLARRLAVGGALTRFEKEGIEFFRRVDRGYKEFFNNTRHAIIDATEDIPTMVKTAEDVVRRELGL